MSGAKDRPKAPSRSEACERLALSRERMRQALHPAQPARAAAPGSFDWQALFKNVPGAPALLGALRAWWAQNPMNGPASMAAAAVQSVLRPFAERHPFALLLGALAAGAALMASRPWRWAPKAALKSGLWAGLPGILAAVVSRWPVHTWLDVLAEGLRKQSASAAAAATAQQGPTAPQTPPMPSPAPPPGG